MIVDFERRPDVTGSGRPDEIITAGVRPDLVREARRGWGAPDRVYTPRIDGRATMSRWSAQRR
jgi:formamidase